MEFVIEAFLFQLMFIGLYLLLKKETFFNYNRAYLLMTSFLSYVLPFVKIDFFQQTTLPVRKINVLPTLFLNNTNKVIENTESIELIWHWWYVILLGSLIMLTMFLLKVKNLVNLYKTNKIERSSVAIIELKNSRSAFSFFNWIFLGSQLNEDERRVILAHELIHVKEKHSWDLLFFEIQRILFWYNPLVYYYQQETMAIHEFIVDEKMIQKSGKQDYCNNMLTQLFGSTKLSFVNTFYKQSLIKKRIAMITKKESKFTATFKYAFIIPLVTGMLFYTSCQQELTETVIENQVDSDENNSSLNSGRVSVEEEALDVLFAAVQTPAVFSGCEDAEDKKKCFTRSIRSHISKNFDTELAESLGLEGLLRLAAVFKIDTNGEVTDILVRAKNEQLKEEFNKTLESLPKMEPATQNGKKVNMIFSLPLVFRVDKEKDKKE